MVMSVHSQVLRIFFFFFHRTTIGLADDDDDDDAHFSCFYISMCVYCTSQLWIFDFDKYMWNEAYFDEDSFSKCVYSWKIHTQSLKRISFFFGFFFFTNLRCFFCFLLQLGWFLFSFFDSWCELCHPNTHSKKYSSSITFITECRPNSYDDFLEHTRLWSPSCAHKHAKYAESDISSYLLIPNVY